MSGRGGQATGAGIEYGKIKIFSSDEKAEDLKKILDAILKSHHYPEEEYFGNDEGDGEETEESPIDDVELDSVEELNEEESPWIKARKQVND